METQVRTPQAIFMMPQRLVVPLFQRPYVWNREKQWEPLWKDISRVADRLLSKPGERELAARAKGERAIVSICTDSGQGTVALLQSA